MLCIEVGLPCTRAYMIDNQNLDSAGEKRRRRMKMNSIESLIIEGRRRRRRRMKKNEDESRRMKMNPIESLRMKMNSIESSEDSAVHFFFNKIKMNPSESSGMDGSIN